MFSDRRRSASIVGDFKRISKAHKSPLTIELITLGPIFGIRRQNSIRFWLKKNFWLILDITLAPRWKSTVVKVDGRAKVDVLEPNWTVIWSKVDCHWSKWTVMGRSGRSFEITMANMTVIESKCLSLIQVVIFKKKTLFGWNNTEWNKSDSEQIPFGK